MQAFISACFSPINLPFTALLILVMLYWGTLIMGAADLELLDSLIPDIDADEGGCLLAPLFQLLNLGEVPAMITVSFLSLFGWWFSLEANHYLNPAGNAVIALVLLIPNFIFSVVAAGLLTRPMRRFFKAETHEKIMYRVGVVITSEVNADFGQIEIATGGAPITLNARARDGLVLEKGEPALIYDEDPEKGIYYVERFKA